MDFNIKKQKYISNLTYIIIYLYTYLLLIVMQICFYAFIPNAL